jgi:hypothetical protein
MLYVLSCCIANMPAQPLAAAALSSSGRSSSSGASSTSSSTAGEELWLVSKGAPEAIKVRATLCIQ